VALSRMNDIKDMIECQHPIVIFRVVNNRDDPFPFELVRRKK